MYFSVILLHTFVIFIFSFLCSFNDLISSVEHKGRYYKNAIRNIFLCPYNDSQHCPKQTLDPADFHYMGVTEVDNGLLEFFSSFK